MATFKFGVNEEDIEKEEAEHRRQMEYEVQERIRIRNKKLEKLTKRYKRNRILTMVIFFIFFSSMLVFGVYNTFFKTSISMDDVNNAILTNNVSFNTYGVEGFLHDTIEPIFNQYADISTADNVKTCEIDPNSVRIRRLQEKTPESAVVYFNANVKIQYEDTYEDKGRGEEERIPGKETYNTYSFRVMLNFKNRGFSYASDLELQPIRFRDNHTTITESDLLSFEEIEEVEKEKLQPIQDKVDRILADLYEGKDVGSDFGQKNKFNTKDTYKGISSFTMYVSDNQLGYNTVCEYVVESIDKITFTNKAYLKVVPSGDNSYKIEQFL